MPDGDRAEYRGCSSDRTGSGISSGPVGPASRLAIRRTASHMRTRLLARRSRVHEPSWRSPTEFASYSGGRALTDSGELPAVAISPDDAVVRRRTRVGSWVVSAAAPHRSDDACD
jgi:hypothetical protein